MFTSNVRQAFEFPERLKGETFRQLYEYTRLPLSVVFGGFPVKVGTPVNFQSRNGKPSLIRTLGMRCKQLIVTQSRLSPRRRKISKFWLKNTNTAQTNGGVLWFTPWDRESTSNIIWLHFFFVHYYIPLLVSFNLGTSFRMGPLPKKDEDGSIYLNADRSSALQESKQFHEVLL